jgi:hypothetical protein
MLVASVASVKSLPFQRVTLRTPTRRREQKSASSPARIRSRWKRGSVRTAGRTVASATLTRGREWSGERRPPPRAAGAGAARAAAAAGPATHRAAGGDLIGGVSAALGAQRAAVLLPEVSMARLGCKTPAHRTRSESPGFRRRHTPAWAASRAGIQLGAGIGRG